MGSIVKASRGTTNDDNAEPELAMVFVRSYRDTHVRSMDFFSFGFLGLFVFLLFFSSSDSVAVSECEIS